MHSFTKSFGQRLRKSRLEMVENGRQRGDENNAKKPSKTHISIDHELENALMPSLLMLGNEAFRARSL